MLPQAIVWFSGYNDERLTKMEYHYVISRDISRHTSAGFHIYARMYECKPTNYETEDFKLYSMGIS